MNRKIVIIIISALLLFAGCSKKSDDVLKDNSENVQIKSMKEYKTIQLDGGFMGSSVDGKYIVEFCKTSVNIIETETSQICKTIKLENKLDKMNLSLHNNRGVVSHDGKYMLFTSNYGTMSNNLIHHTQLDILAVDIDNSKLVRVVDVEDSIRASLDGEVIYSPRWLDNKRILYAVLKDGNTTINSISINGSDKEVLYELDKSENKVISSFLPLGENCLLLSLDGMKEDKIVIYNTKDKSQKTIITNQNNEMHLLKSISDDNKILVVNTVFDKQVLKNKNTYSIISFSDTYKKYEVAQCNFNDENINEAILTKNGKYLVGLLIDDSQSKARYYCHDIENNKTKLLYEVKLDNKEINSKNVWNMIITSDNRLYDTQGDTVIVYELN